MKLNRDLIAGCVLLAGSIGYYAMAADLPKSFLDTIITSSALPKSLGIGAGVLSIILIVQSLMAQRKSKVAAGPAPSDPTLNSAQHDEAADDRGWMPHIRALGVLAIAVGTVILLAFAGYAVAIACLLFVTARYQSAFYGQSRPILVDIRFAAIGAFGFWVVFVKLLGVSMPLGLWRYVL
jgi:putative tricarboxylic transport membrane protein